MSDKTAYGKFDKFIHWLMAINIGLTLVFSKGMTSLPDAERFAEYTDHAASVTTIMICLIIRAIWRMKEGFPLLPETMEHWQKLAAKGVHYGLYAALFAQVAIGVLLASTVRSDFVAPGYNINYTAFDLVDDDWHDSLLSAHLFMYWTIVGLLVVHVVAAIKHHYVDKDDVLRRMLPFVKSGASAD